MNILYTLNDNFVPQVAAGICSVCENNKNIKNINFYIISYGIKDINKKELIKIVNNYNRNMNIIELDSLEKYIDFDYDTLGWNKVILARIFMGKLLPENIKKILYLDGDTIVRGSLKELWDLKMGDKILGMSIEPTVDKKRKNKLGLEKYPYYNSGVLLVDLEKWRKEKADEKIIEFYKKNNGNLFAADQDAINGALKDKIYTISPKYNFYNIFYQYPYKFLKKLMGQVPYISKKEFDSAVKEPVIIHFLGEERPWRLGNNHKYKNDYLKSLNLTNYKNCNFEDGWKLYFICFGIFNFFTKPFPFIRYKIINSLIPVFMKYRTNKNKKNK